MSRCRRLRSSVRMLNCTMAVSMAPPKRGNHPPPRAPETISGSSTILRRVRP
jgi:hypothetical protein